MVRSRHLIKRAASAFPENSWRWHVHVMNGQPHSAHAQSADLQTGADLIRKRSHHSQLTSGDPDRYVVKKSTTGTSDIGRLALSFARDGRNLCRIYFSWIFAACGAIRWGPHRDTGVVNSSSIDYTYTSVPAHCFVILTFHVVLHTATWIKCQRFLIRF